MVECCLKQEKYKELKGYVEYHASTLIAGLGVKGMNADDLVQEFWLYLIEHDMRGEQFIRHRMIDIIRTFTGFKNKVRNDQKEVNLSSLRSGDSEKDLVIGYSTDDKVISDTDFTDFLRSTRMSIRDREIVYLWYKEGWKQADLAEEYGITKQRISQIIEKSKPSIKIHFSEY